MLTFKLNKIDWISWLLLFVVGVFLVSYFLVQAKIQLGGDIAEYYGLTQTLISEQSVSLSPDQEQNLRQKLHSAYFDNPHYYVVGRDQNRYPVHFFAYSLLTVPIRIATEIMGYDPLRSLSVMNVMTFLAAIAFIWYRYIKDTWQRCVLLGLALFSPLMTFFIWPGPDLWYLSLLLVALFAFLHSDKKLSVTLVLFSSWHSQPLIVLAALMAAYDILKTAKWKLNSNQRKLTLDLRKVAQYGLIGMLGLVPYFYNIYAFGSLTPWTNLEDGWTAINGFGIHNASFQKSFEQLFDLNVGQFWYAPLLFILGFFSVIKAFVKKKWDIFVLPILFSITALFYQTNPGWHYGTSGYGPGRHGLLYLPLVILLTYEVLKKKHIALKILFVITISLHIFTLSFNSFLEPNLTKTLHHSVFATYALEHFPILYNPTPEIFVDRTNHDDQTVPTSAIYKNKEGKCVKAWVLLSDRNLLEQECGNLTNEQSEKLDDRYLKVSNKPRDITVTQATFWPYSDACSDWFYKTTEKPYECARTLNEFIKLTNITEVDRVTTLPDFPFPGIWKLNPGKPTTITIPAGYIIHYQAIDGTYIDFTTNN